MRKYNPGGKPTDVYNWYGMTVAWTMVETLREAGKNLTRAGLLQAAQSLDTAANPFLLPGIRLKTSSTDYRPLEQVFSTARRRAVGEGKPDRPREGLTRVSYATLAIRTEGT